MLWPKLAFSALLGLYFGHVTAWAEPGFLTADSAQIPEAIHVAAGKVLQLWTPIGYSLQPQSKYASILRALDKVQPSNLRQTLTYRMMRADVRSCQARGTPVCRVTDQVTQGSAFVLEDGTLLAARHNFSQTGSGLAVKFANSVKDWNADAASFDQNGRVQTEIAAFRRDPLRDAVFILTDLRQKIVFDSSEQAFRFLRFGSLSRIQGTVDLVGGSAGLIGDNASAQSPEYSGPDWVDGDSVRIQLSVRLPALHSAARESCLPGARIVIAGFAGQDTQNRKALGAQDAVYNELSVSQGNILTLAEVALRAAHWSDWRRYVQEVRGRPVLLTDADGTKGMSGGPILNSRGEVCGLFKAVYPGDETPYYNSRNQVLELFSFGIPLENLTGI